MRTNGVKPNFQQVGPFVYREDKLKEDITWYSNKTVSFYGQRTWYFEPEMSGASLDDLVTCPHLPSLVRNVANAFDIFVNHVHYCRPQRA